MAMPSHISRASSGASGSWAIQSVKASLTVLALRIRKASSSALLQVRHMAKCLLADNRVHTHVRKRNLQNVAANHAGGFLKSDPPGQLLRRPQRAPGSIRCR